MKRFLLVIFMTIGAVELLAQVDIIHAAVEFDFIPEGIAVDHNNRDIYLSSLHLDKISRISSTKRPADVITAGQHNYSIGVGMEVVGGKLYALSDVDRSGVSQLIIVNVENNSLVNKFDMDRLSFFNDLAVLDSFIYLTDTDSHRVYRCNQQSGAIEVFLEDETLQYPNGITISDDGTKMFVDSYSDGIRVVDLETGLVVNSSHDGSSSIGIDGLKYYQGNLYGVVNGGATPEDRHGFYKFLLSSDEKDILGVEPIFIDHPLMDIPTTFDIVNGTVYLLANSQMDQLNQAENLISDPAALTPTYILRFSLE